MPVEAQAVTRLPSNGGLRDASGHAQIFEGACGIIALMLDGQLDAAGPFSGVGSRR